MMSVDFMPRKPFRLERIGAGHHEFKPDSQIEDTINGLGMAIKLAGNWMRTREAARRGLLSESGSCSSQVAKGEIVF